MQNEKKYGKNSLSYILKDNIRSYDVIYHTHNNGFISFQVSINLDGIFIYLYDEESESESDISYYSNPLIKITDFMGYWYGFDTSGYNYHGNSILVKIKDNDYIFIGHYMYEFSTDEEIIDYISPVGHSDVPYPIAYSHDNIYFMCDHKYINKTHFKIDIDVDNAEMIYAEYYDVPRELQNEFKNYKPLKFLV